MDWQGRASQLVNLIDPGRSFAAGEFESLDDVAWTALVADLRAKALTNEKLADIQQREADKQAEKAAALSKLTAKEREVLGL